MALFGTPHKRRPGETMRHQMPAQQALPWAQGGKAGWKDFAGLALAGIGDAFSNANGGQSGAMQNMIAGRETTRMEALRAAAEAAAEARKRQAGNEDWRSRYDYEVANPKTQQDDWAYTDDNVGNVWRYNKKTGLQDPNPVFVDEAPKMYIQGDRAVKVPNPYSTKSRAGPQLGQVIDGFMFKGGDPNNPSNWSEVR